MRRKGHKVLVKMFATRSEAEHWAAEQERAIRLTGLPRTLKELEKHTLGDIVRRYRDEITPIFGCCVSETSVLNKFLRHKICAKSLAYISSQDAYEYINERLKEVKKNGQLITPRTEVVPLPDTGG